MVYLSNMHQAGLTILPTHRMLRHLGAWQPERFLDQAGQYFDCSAYAVPSNIDQDEVDKWQAALRDGRRDQGICIGFLWRSASQFYTLRAKRDAVFGFLAAEGVAEVLRGLDVVVLDRVLLRRVMGLSETFLANENNIHFKHHFADGVARLRAGDYDVGFFINPTRIEQVQEVASAGLIMPHKSTYFYPKVFSGMVINPLNPHEEMIW
jgi:uncharacterized protein (DUF1015 family)